MTTAASPDPSLATRARAASLPRRASTRTAVVAQVRAEWCKVRTVRAPLAIAGAAVLLECVLKVVSVVLLDPVTATEADVVLALKPSIS